MFLVYNPHVSNLIEVPWGLIVEGKRDATQSHALIYIDPGQAKPPEYHAIQTETFTHHFGLGVIIIENMAHELRSGGEPITVKPGEIYEIINLEAVGLLSLSVRVEPPFDPNDVHLVPSQV